MLLKSFDACLLRTNGKAFPICANQPNQRHLRAIFPPTTCESWPSQDP